MKSFMDSIIEKRGKLVVLCQGNSEFVVPYSDDDETGFINENDLTEKFVRLSGRRYMHIVGGNSIAIPDHDRLILTDSIAVVEFADGNTERWEELKNLYHAYVKVMTMTPEEKEEAARKANAVKNLLLPPNVGKRN